MSNWEGLHSEEQSDTRIKEVELVGEKQFGLTGSACNEGEAVFAIIQIHGGIAGSKDRLAP